MNIEQMDENQVIDRAYFNGLPKETRQEILNMTRVFNIVAEVANYYKRDHKFFPSISSGGDATAVSGDGYMWDSVSRLNNYTKINTFFIDTDEGEDNIYGFEVEVNGKQVEAVEEKYLHFPFTLKEAREYRLKVMKEYSDLVEKYAASPGQAAKEQFTEVISEIADIAEPLSMNNAVRTFREMKASRKAKKEKDKKQKETARKVKETLGK